MLHVHIHDDRTSQDVALPLDDVLRSRLPEDDRVADLDAYHRGVLMDQFVSRVVRRREVGYPCVYNPGALHPVVFDYETANVDGWMMASVPYEGIVYNRFVCSEPGWYNLKTNFTVRLSVPAVSVVMMTAVHLFWTLSRHTQTVNTYRNWFGAQQPLVSTFSPHDPATNQPCYLRAWSMTGVDKIPLWPGDELFLQWMHESAQPIAYIDLYRAHCAIQKTGDFATPVTCCDDEEVFYGGLL